MAQRRVKGMGFEMYGTLVDVGAVAEACRAVVPDPAAFATQWRAKQLEYTFLPSLMETYRDFWRVSEETLAFTIRRFGLGVCWINRTGAPLDPLGPEPDLAAKSFDELAAALG